MPSRVSAESTVAQSHTLPSQDARKRVLHPGFVVACTCTVAILALLFTWCLEQAPPYLNQDEAGFGLASYLLATSSRDAFGNFLPVFILYFDHGELGNALICYWAIPFVKLIGLSPVSLRLSMVAAGMVSLLLFGVLSWKLTRDRWVSLLGVWLLATSPLFFIQSRIFLDPLLTVPFVIGWLICLAQFDSSGDRRHLLLASVVLGVGAYSYSTARMLMPLYLGVTLVAHIVSGRCCWRTAAISLGIYALLMLPMLGFAVANRDSYGSRFWILTWFGRPESSTPVSTYLVHYMAHFDPVDLFVTGDSSLVHSTGRAGAFPMASLPLAAVGVVSTLRRVLRERSIVCAIVLLALILFPVPTALLAEMHRLARAAHLIPLYVLLCVMGLYTLVVALRRWPMARLLLAGIGILWLVEVSLFLRDYYTQYPARVVAENYSLGNRPLAFRTLMETGAETLYVDREDSMMSSYAHFFQIECGYAGTVSMVKPAEAAKIPLGGLLLTRRPEKFEVPLEVIARIPEIAPDVPNYYVLRRQGTH